MSNADNLNQGKPLTSSYGMHQSKSKKFSRSTPLIGSIDRKGIK